MIDLLLYILAGGSVGFVVGVTGVGGGSFMTPILLAFGFQPAIAVGTDLLYAAITKAGGVISHQKQNTIQWQIVKRLCYGSIPATLATLAVLSYFQQEGINYQHILTKTLGIMLVITSIVLLFRTFLINKRIAIASEAEILDEPKKVIFVTVFMGFMLGVLVTLSSVGAGALGAAILLTLYPRMSMIKIIATDLAHAVPLTFIAGIGHMQLGHVNFILLGSLLVGSLPAIWLGTKVANKLPEKIMQPLMATILLLIGVGYIIK